MNVNIQLIKTKAVVSDGNNTVLTRRNYRRNSYYTLMISVLRNHIDNSCARAHTHTTQRIIQTDSKLSEILFPRLFMQRIQFLVLHPLPNNIGKQFILCDRKICLICSEHNGETIMTMDLFVTSSEYAGNRYAADQTACAEKPLFLLIPSFGCSHRSRYFKIQ